MRFIQQRATSPESMDEDTLRASLQEFPLSMAVLFGSHANGTAHARSDLDVAVRFEDTVSDGHSVQLLNELTAELTRASCFEAIDLLDLDNAPPKLGYEILSRGTLLLGDESEATELEGQFLLRALDFEPVAEEWHTALAERIVEGTYGQPDRVRTRLDDLEEYLRGCVEKGTVRSMSIGATRTAGTSSSVVSKKLLRLASISPRTSSLPRGFENRTITVTSSESSKRKACFPPQQPARWWRWWDSGTYWRTSTSTSRTNVSTTIYRTSDASRAMRSRSSDSSMNSDFDRFERRFSRAPSSRGS